MLIDCAASVNCNCHGTVCAAMMPIAFALVFAVLSSSQATKLPEPPSPLLILNLKNLKLKQTDTNSATTPQDVFDFSGCSYAPTNAEQDAFYGSSDVQSCVSEYVAQLETPGCIDIDGDRPDDCLRASYEVSCNGNCISSAKMFYDLCYFDDHETLEETKSSYDMAIKAFCGRGPGGELCGYIYSKDGGVLFEFANNFCPSDELVVNNYQLVCSAGCAYSVRLGKEIFGCCMNNLLLDKDIAAGYDLGDSSYLASDELFTECEGEKNNLGFCFGGAAGIHAQPPPVVVLLLGAVAIATMVMA